MINIKFPDGSVKEFEKGITGFEIAASISRSLAKDAIVVEIDGALADLSLSIDKDADLRILTTKDPESLEIIRHMLLILLLKLQKNYFLICR